MLVAPRVPLGGTVVARARYLARVQLSKIAILAGGSRLGIGSGLQQLVNHFAQEFVLRLWSEKAVAQGTAREIRGLIVEAFRTANIKLANPPVGTLVLARDSQKAPRVSAEPAESCAQSVKEPMAGGRSRTSFE